tara:strand:- start:3131 stop:3601 length:471 start_codon:yes stop_codon:yes gene_type:complete
MAAEIIAAVQMCSSAYRFMKTAVNEGKDIGDMSRAVGKFFDAREEISVLEQKATNSGAIQKLFGGKSIEAQALELTLQKNRAVQLEKDLKDLFLWSGRGDLWESTIRERARLRNMRIAEAKARAQSKAAMLDILAIIGTIAAVFIVAMAITSVAVE